MIRKYLSELLANKVRRDAVAVEVFNNNIEAAVKRLHKKMQEAGILRELKLRRDNPRRQDRRRAKALRSKSNLIRHLKRKAASDARDKSR